MRDEGGEAPGRAHKLGVSDQRAVDTVNGDRKIYAEEVNGKTERTRQRKCILVPVYQEGKTIGPLIHKIREFVSDVVVVDDGSTDDTAEQARQAGAHVLTHPENMGKGVALNTGFRHVRDRNYDYVICLDGNGRHNPADIPCFIDAYERTGIPVLIGNRMRYPALMPRSHRLANRFLSWLLSVTMEQYIPDTQCGFRLYRCDVLPFVEAHESRFAAESEVLLHAVVRGVRVGAVPIKAVYGVKQRETNVMLLVWRFVVLMFRHYRQRHGRRSDW